MTMSFYGRRGMAVAPHSLAAESAVAVMREGGNAIEAMIAAAATIAVVYPHMNSIGGDGFWVIRGPKGVAGGIDAAGHSAALASVDTYAKDRGITGSIPFRGGDAALTVAGTVAGWGRALELSRSVGGRMPLSRLLEDAIWYADYGVPVTHGQYKRVLAKFDELSPVAGFVDTFLVDGVIPEENALFKQPRLAQTLRTIAKKGCDDFYRGGLARDNAADLERLGSPIRLNDLQSYQARLVDPLTIQTTLGRLWNMTPPSQGLVSLTILGIMDRLAQQNPRGLDDPMSARFVHAQVEATKQAFLVRDQHLTDPAFMSVSPESLLASNKLDAMAAAIDWDRAAPWGKALDPGDTIWMGAVDQGGIAVSFIQSIYHEFGSGIVLPSTGVNWQNRGCGFSLNPSHINRLEPRKRPFHTLNAGLTESNDGRVMVYGTMGGDGQPQTQACIYSRVMRFGLDPQAALEMPRWLLGRTWGNPSDTLKLESRFPAETVASLKALGHDVEMLEAMDESVGHAGAIVREKSGLLVGGFDPRSNGGVAGF